MQVELRQKRARLSSVAGQRQDAALEALFEVAQPLDGGRPASATDRLAITTVLHTPAAHSQRRADARFSCTYQLRDYSSGSVWLKC
jgi:hypothetical protein